jgi:hypothetical protein
MQAAEARPPFVSFEAKAVEDREQTIATGYYQTKDVDYALITPQGSKDRIEREVNDWFINLRQQTAEGRFPAEWLRHFEGAYKAWKNGQELPLNGTPIKTWPALSPSQVKQILEVELRTVEDLAAANEETIMRLGMGGRALKDKAVSWLSAASTTGKAAEELAASRAAVSDMKLRNEALEKQVKDLAAQVAKLAK